VFQDQTRRRLRAGGLLLVLLGLISVALGIAAPQLAPDLAPALVTLGRPARLPAAGPFGGRVALYGRATSAELLGCQVATARGRPFTLHPAGVGTLATLDRRVVDGRAVVPMLEFSSAPSGSTITCIGPGAVAAQPMYLIVSAGQRDLVPMAAFSLATLALALGFAAVIGLRPLPSI
jgi:hypothetical protein